MLVLASASPRRRELLARFGEEFICEVSHFEEIIPEGLAAEALPQYFAEGKAAEVFGRLSAARMLPEAAVVIGADTLVCLDGRPLGKPENAGAALDMLRQLSGRKHQVLTGFCLQAAWGVYAQTVCTEVEFYPLQAAELERYVASGEPFDKAGGYGIQTQGAFFVKAIYGDYYNVMGLPIAELRRALEAFRGERKQQ